jgi:chaperonin GroEL
MQDPFSNTVDFHLRDKDSKITFQPDTYRAVQKGIHQILNAVRPTLGPVSRTVLVDRYVEHAQPDILDAGATIARRVIQIKDRDANTGAMMIRGMMYRLNERVGDGTVTAAVLYASIFDQCLKFIQAGGSPMSLRRGLEKGLVVVMETLEEMVVPVNDRADLSGVARTVCHDDVMAAELGDIFATIGEFGLLETNTGRSRENYYEFVLGHYWPTEGLLVDPTIENVSTRKELLNAGIFVSDLEFKTADDLLPLLRAALLAELDALVIIALKMSDEVMKLIYQSQRSSKLRILAVKGPYILADKMQQGLEDIAVLTGANAFHQATGISAANVTPHDLGHVRRFWVDKEVFSFNGGGGDSKAIRNYVDDLRERFARSEKPAARALLKERIGRMLGGAANFEVGGLTKPEIEIKRSTVKRTEATLRAAVRSGLLPGGGTALLACQKPLAELFETLTDRDEQIAVKILIQALEEPLKELLKNSGLEVPPILNTIKEADQVGYGYDLLTHQYGDMMKSGVVDVADVVKDGVRTAVKSAALALTVDVIIHKKDPIIMQNPE